MLSGWIGREAGMSGKGGQRPSEINRDGRRGTTLQAVERCPRGSDQGQGHTFGVSSV